MIDLKCFVFSLVFGVLFGFLFYELIMCIKDKND